MEPRSSYLAGRRLGKSTMTTNIMDNRIMPNPRHEPVTQKTLADGTVYAITKCGAWVRLTPRRHERKHNG